MSRLRPAPAASPRRRLAAAALATVGLIGLGTASAAQLNPAPQTLAAGAATVGDCQAGAPIQVRLTSTWYATGRYYRSTGAQIYNVNPACAGQIYRLSLLNSGGSALAEVTGTVPVGGGSFATSAFTAQTTTNIDHAEVVIHS